MSAGEASGDHYGAALIRELLTRFTDCDCFGLGGKEMAEAGLDRVVKAEDVAHMGITEVIRHMPRIYGEYRRLVRTIKARRPNVAILIDFPDVNLRLARELKKLRIPVVYFVSPQLWAWKRRRLRWVQQRVDRMMVIFPFEETFYRSRGVVAEFVGHPLAELPLPATSREAYASQHGLDPAKTWIALLPGSRLREVELNLPVMLESADSLNLEQNCEFLLPVASTIPSETIKGLMRLWSERVHRNSPPRRTNIQLVDDAREALLFARASVVASGTATVQAAVIGNPFIVVYRVSSLTYRLAKRLIHYPPEIPAPEDVYGNLPIAMVNLIAGRRVVPELIQERFTAGNVISALRPLLTDGEDRDRMIADLGDVRRRLSSQTGSSSIQRVCNTVEALLRQTEAIGGRNPSASV